MMLENKAYLTTPAYFNRRQCITRQINNDKHTRSKMIGGFSIDGHPVRIDDLIWIADVDGALGVLGCVMRFRWGADERVERLSWASARGPAAAVFLLELLQLMLQKSDSLR